MSADVIRTSAAHSTDTPTAASPLKLVIYFTIIVTLIFYFFYKALNTRKLACILLLYIVCLNLTYSRDECRRPLKYYAYGGVLCRNYYRGGNCKNFKTFLAVNVNGVKATGSDNITYQRGSTLTICDPQDTRCYDSLTDSHEDYMGLVHRGDRCLYKSYIYSLHRENCNCLSTPIKRLVDGRYELILKFVDPSLTGRTFDIKLNKVTVLKDFRILRYTSINYKPLEAFIQFEVRDNRTTLILKGHPPSKIKKCKISLAFCRGD